jgi:hypothetical protein
VVTGDAGAGGLSVCGRLELTGGGTAGAWILAPGGREAGAAAWEDAGSTGAEAPIAAGEGAVTEGGADGTPSGPETDRECPPIARVTETKVTVATVAAARAVCCPFTTWLT